jgi:hypothetical protein
LGEAGCWVVWHPHITAPSRMALVNAFFVCWNATAFLSPDQLDQAG